jgi:hypothetical protein
MLIATTTSMATTANVFAYDRNQAISSANACGNGQVPTNVGCQNTGSSIQGDENSVALTSQQTFPSAVREVPIEPPTTTPGTLTVIKEVRCAAGISDCPTSSEFLMRVEGAPATPAEFEGESGAGRDVQLVPGSYSVEETVPELPPNTINTESQTEDCEGTISAGETKTCTVTNTLPKTL